MGQLFPDTDPAQDGRDSADFLREAVRLAHHAGWRVVNLDTTVVLERPKIGPAKVAIRASLDACRVYGCQLIVNDYWRQAIAEVADYVHLGQDDLQSADLGAIRRAGVRLGVSTHDEAELARALDTAPDYIALGPVFPTTLKVMRFAPQGLDRVGQWKRRVGAIPLVAIGGITLERAAEVYAQGADSIAVVSDVTSNPDPEARIRAWLAAERGQM